MKSVVSRAVIGVVARGPLSVPMLQPTNPTGCTAVHLVQTAFLRFGINQANAAACIASRNPDV
jgi:hypothetical protein